MATWSTWCNPSYGLREKRFVNGKALGHPAHLQKACGPCNRKNGFYCILSSALPGDHASGKKIKTILYKCDHMLVCFIYCYHQNSTINLRECNPQQGSELTSHKLFVNHKVFQEKPLRYICSKGMVLELLIPHVSIWTDGREKFDCNVLLLKGGQSYWYRSRVLFKFT